MQKYVQTPTNLYCTFCKSVGHDDRDCRAYDLMHERSRDIYKIQGEVQQEGTLRSIILQEEETSTLMVDSEEEEEEEVWVEDEDRSFVITVQPGHLARDCQNPCTTCSYCNSFEHVIEDCPVLLAKLQERRGPQQNPQVQLI
jgi:hypothetical protein